MPSQIQKKLFQLTLFTVSFNLLFLVPALFAIPSRGKGEIFWHAAILYPSLLIFLLYTQNKVQALKTSAKQSWPVLLSLAFGAFAILHNQLSLLDSPSPIKATVEILGFLLCLTVLKIHRPNFSEDWLLIALVGLALWIGWSLYDFYQTLAFNFAPRFGMSIRNNNPIITGYFLGPILLVSLYLTLTKIRTWQIKTLWFSFCSLIFFALLMTKSRGDIGAILIALTLMFFFQFKGKGVMIALGVIGASLGMIYALELNQQIFNRAYESSILKRLYMWEEAYGIWMNNFWLGTGNIEPYLYADDATARWSPHGLWPWALIFGGSLFTGSLLLCVCIALYRSFLLAWKGEGMVFYWLVFGLAALMTDGGSFFRSFNAYWIVFWIPLLFAIMKFEPLQMVQFKDSMPFESRDKST